jgi:5-amino-6-(5-phosphoribosylamino)uracil reductase
MITGPGHPFEVVFDVDSDSSDGLPEQVRAIYGGNWVIPDSDDPYCFSMFVMSHDGRVSFAVPGHEGGGDVSGFNPHDQWLMGLLRARADAVMVGANTLRNESEHLWTPDYIFPGDAAGFAELRALEGRKKTPLHVFVTRSGDITPDAEVFHREDILSAVVTTKSGAAAVEGRSLPRTEIIVAGQDSVDLPLAVSILRERFGVRTLLCEGGPRLYGAAVGQGIINEEFLTLSPVLIGQDPESSRPGLLESLAYNPGSTSRAELIGLRRAGDYLFLRTRLRHTTAGIGSLGS